MYRLLIYLFSLCTSLRDPNSKIFQRDRPEINDDDNFDKDFNSGFTTASCDHPVTNDKIVRVFIMDQCFAYICKHRERER